MKTVVFASEKGGVGRTTLLWHVALEAAKSNSVYIADQDTQGSLHSFYSVAEKPENPKLLSIEATIESTVKVLERNGHGRDVLFVDLGRFNDKDDERTLRRCDCIVFPIQPSPLDYWANSDFGKFLAEANAWQRVIAVMNQCENPHDNVVDEILRLQEKDASQTFLVRRRRDYAVAALHKKPQSAYAWSEAAGDEIWAIWQGIRAKIEIAATVNAKSPPENDGKTPRCKATTKSGKPCPNRVNDFYARNITQKAEGLCGVHAELVIKESRHARAA